MNTNRRNLLSPNQVTYLLLGIMINEGIISLPNEVAKIAKQDGWISVLFGAIYPLYILFIAFYLSSKFPNDNILVLSKRYLGKMLGSVLNILFSLLFVLYLTSACSGISNFLRTYILSFLTPLKFISLFILVSAYTAYKGLTVIGRLCECIFYFSASVILVPLASIRTGSILNILPVTGSGWMNILKGGINSAYSYGCIEIIFLIYPFISDRTQLKKSSLKAVMLTCISYTWITFMTIYYLSHNVILKTRWSSIYVTENLNITFISNFRYILLFLWILVTLKSTAASYYAFVTILSDSIKKFKSKDLIYICYPLIVFLSIMYGSEEKKKYITSYFLPIITIYVLLYSSLIALLIFIKKDKAYEKT
ncbi:spore germination protein [Clostridium sp. CX1]|uniref:GerAB/ArcD/ProY family transporter n=1 Tax=Clostridium sp. CX1 TaxID=2978346 RepID=UPI0021BFE2B3|nr:spore germination protein [Clostridium sp. CX1]MCT8976714.1 spore germination protein [Clostridium sp. CX1]